MKEKKMNKEELKKKILNLIQKFNSSFSSSPLTYQEFEKEFKSQLSWEDEILWNNFRQWENLHDGTYKHILPIGVETPANRKEKKEIEDWEDFKHPNIPYNQFHELTTKELEGLAELVDESLLTGMKKNGPQMGFTNINGMLLDPDPITRGGWETISKTQPNGEEEQYDSYGLRRFWNTKPERRSRRSVDYPTTYTIEDILGE